ncbi:MAG TPA: PQQ-dependent sugar dehydrogenase [Candidatus Paceibacterota bacterium]|nr:PQQ-dependent sugar dehydrogenase [Candidatus Paceibacterota bacterium]
MKKIILAILIIMALVFIVYRFQTDDNSTDLPIDAEEKVVKAEITEVATELYVPWSIEFGPDYEMIVAERNGTIRFLGDNKMEIKVPGVVERGEGGLLGLALHPDFLNNEFLYLYYTTVRDGKTINRVVRYTLSGDKLKEDKVIVDNIPGGTNHNGGRIIFGPDGLLYITTGDSGNEMLAQDTKSLAGKILRVHDDGRIPADNPFGNEVYSYGHRNPQGLTWDTEGVFWEVEHGRSGLQSGYDEVNRIEKGGNYGWPVIQGDEKGEGMKTPELHSGPSTTWAPAGITYGNNNLFFTGLRGEALYEVGVRNGKLESMKIHLQNEYGRLRAIARGPDGSIYVGTSNKDGRGNTNLGDDKILKIKF